MVTEHTFFICSLWKFLFIIIYHLHIFCTFNRSLRNIEFAVKELLSNDMTKSKNNKQEGNKMVRNWGI